MGLPIKGVEVTEGWRTLCVSVYIYEAGSATICMYMAKCDRHLEISF